MAVLAICTSSTRHSCPSNQLRYSSSAAAAADMAAALTLDASTAGMCGPAVAFPAVALRSLACAAAAFAAALSLSAVRPAISVLRLSHSLSRLSHSSLFFASFLLQQAATQKHRTRQAPWQSNTALFAAVMREWLSLARLLDDLHNHTFLPKPCAPCSPKPVCLACQNLRHTHLSASTLPCSSFTSSQC